jgi:hypothetical protein
MTVRYEKLSSADTRLRSLLGLDAGVPDTEHVDDVSIEVGATFEHSAAFLRVIRHDADTVTCNVEETNDPQHLEIGTRVRFTRVDAMRILKAYLDA